MMKKIHLVGFGLVCMLSIMAWSLLGNRSQNASPQNHEESAADTKLANTSPPHQGLHGEEEPHHKLSGTHASPFELSNMSPQMMDQIAREAKLTPNNMLEVPVSEPISPTEAARRKKLEDLGYMLPPDYYTKDLKALRKMAKAGDSYAMMHIGEKYYFELQGQPNHPEFDKSINYGQAAKVAFQDALIAGNIRSAGIIAELYYQEKNALEAYAWHLVSDRLGDDISADWFRRTDMAQQSSADLKLAAAERAEQILSDLKLKKRPS
ncbi:hypothetical protein [Undibacterium fentianense]|uniref:Sel1 repeat family protein n=1 Tax=Undibacterium fentianense TaxID=2828728 RepID=A0A941IDV8_9BURK|nr:hypothetical protein [Undibacterium fentianense]MBR7800403.1 hypothetical protein [Undibacterium fentianense]